MSDSRLKHGKYQLITGSVIHPVQRKTEKKTANMREYLLGKEFIIRQLVHTPQQTARLLRYTVIIRRHSGYHSRQVDSQRLKRIIAEYRIRQNSSVLSKDI